MFRTEQANPPRDGGAKRIVCLHKDFHQFFGDGQMQQFRFWGTNPVVISVYDPNVHPKVIANLPGLTSLIEEPVTLTYDI